MYAYLQQDIGVNSPRHERLWQESKHEAIQALSAESQRHIQA